MARKPKNSGKTVPNKPREQVPPGATRKAFDRPLNPGGGPPGSGAGPRHAAGDEGSNIEEEGRDAANQPLAGPAPEEEDPLETGPPYAGISGGAVGGTPAEGRSSGGNLGRGISPGGVHRGDSTIGADP